MMQNVIELTFCRDFSWTGKNLGKNLLLKGLGKPNFHGKPLNFE
jgi:hypothetical protein